MKEEDYKTLEEIERLELTCTLVSEDGGANWLMETQHNLMPGDTLQVIKERNLPMQIPISFKNEMFFCPDLNEFKQGKIKWKQKKNKRN